MFEKIFFEELHKIFKSPKGRSDLLSAMIEAIRLDLMEKRQKDVSFVEACDILMNETNNVISSYMEDEKNRYINKILKSLEL